MNTVCDKKMCSGCRACINVCSQKAIEIIETISEYNAVINLDKCINCNACRKVCQYNVQPKFRTAIFWKQGWAKEEGSRNKSSSGGLAYEIEKGFVESKGKVYSCIFKEGEFQFSCIDKVEELEELRGSKYVKSNPKFVYREIAENLKKGFKVLFVGLPCQVASLVNYVGDNENLYTIDLVCHGTPSPLLLQKYLLDHNMELENIFKIKFRDNHNFHLEINNSSLSGNRILDSYMLMFLRGCSYTENCYYCKFARKERISDVTLGDSWGSTFSVNEQRKGISLILANTEKGRWMINNSAVELRDVDLNNAIRNNQQLIHPAAIPLERKKFFDNIYKGKSFESAVVRAYPIQHVKNIVKRVMIRLKLLK